MFKRMAVAAALVLACGGVMAQDEKAPKGEQPKAEKASQEVEMPKLMVGDKAPALTVAKWVKGEPVTGFEKGKTYIVEFWATWCGPCKVSIPHLTDLQEKHKDVKIIGVSVWENDQAKVEPFVTETGEKMEYTVAMDEVPPLPEDVKAGTRPAQKFYIENGKMSKSWMSASASGGIPTAFIVNGEGKVAWIGHPMVKMDEALEKVTSGKQDLAADAKAYRREKETEAKVKPIEQAIFAAMQEGDMDKALSKMDEIIDLGVEKSSMWAGQKYTLLMTQVKDYDKAYAFGNKVVEGVGKDEPQLLNTVAWFIVDPDNTPEKVDLALAEKASQRSNELTKMKDGMFLDTLAAVYYAKKDYAKAVEFQEKAVKAAQASPPAGMPQEQVDDMMDQMKARLEKFKKVAAGGGS